MGHVHSIHDHQASIEEGLCRYTNTLAIPGNGGCCFDPHDRISCRVDFQEAIPSLEEYMRFCVEDEMETDSQLKLRLCSPQDLKAKCYLSMTSSLEPGGTARTDRVWDLER